MSVTGSVGLASLDGQHLQHEDRGRGRLCRDPHCTGHMNVQLPADNHMWHTISEKHSAPPVLGISHAHRVLLKRSVRRKESTFHSDVQIVPATN